MTIIRFTCQRCGDIELKPDNILLILNGSDNVYKFTCTYCNLSQSRKADENVVKAFRTLGVKVELVFALQNTKNQLPNFTEQDIIIFHKLLKDDAWLQNEVKQMKNKSS